MSDGTIAPPGKFRVVIWRGAERHFAVDGDYDDLAAASRRADELLQQDGVFNASVFGSAGYCRYSAISASRPDFVRPLSATSVAGFTSPEDRARRRGNHSRR